MELKGFRIVGFYREQGHFRGIDLPSIRDAAPDVRLDDLPRVHKYLTEAHWVTLVMEASEDLLAGELREGEPELAGGPSLHSDGTWVWPHDLAYYVRKCGLALPGDFLDHIRAQRYEPPELTRLQRMRLNQWAAHVYA